MEATLEPRLVMKGEEGTPYVEGEFFVASYQRGYRWSRQEVHQLLDDIRANAKAAEANRTTPSDYFLQPVVVLGRDDDTWELVDGQQRLTTLLLITRYIRTKLADAEVHYSLTYETRENSRKYLETLDPARRDENTDFFHMAAAYEAIEEWFENPKHGTPLQSAIELHTALSKWVFVIWYEAPKGTNPSALFTRLNRDRIPLTDAELIKALVLSSSGASDGQGSWQQEIAAQWDGIERDLRDEQLWAFLTGATQGRQTHIDFLFESMTPTVGLRARPLYWTFDKVRELIDEHEDGTEGFWRDVVARHGLLTGWFHNREMYHRVGYLVAVGDSVADLIEASQAQTHSSFQRQLVERTRKRLNVSSDEVSLLGYNKDDRKCTQALLLMNVQTVLASSDKSSRFPFYAYLGGGWSLEHIHAQNSVSLKKEKQRRDWLTAHRKQAVTTAWDAQSTVRKDAVLGLIDKHLALPVGSTDDLGFQEVLDAVFDLFSLSGDDASSDDLHTLGNLALLQRDHNSMLNNAVFAVKRERILELDQSGTY